MHNPRSIAPCARLCFLLLTLAMTSLAQTPPQASAPLAELQKQALEEAQAGRSDDAQRDLRLALEAQPDWKEGWWNLGVLQYGANHFTDAQVTFRHVVQFAPGLGNAWALLGLSEFETGDLTEAHKHLETALSLGLNDDEETRRVATYHLALLLIRDGSFAQASDLLLKSFSTAPVSREVQFALGLTMLRMPLLPAEIDPSREAVVLAAGHLVADGDGALAAFPAFLAAYPDTPYTHLAFAQRLEAAGRHPEALQQLRLETSLSPASPLPWRSIGDIEQHLGHPAQARAAFQKATSLEARQASEPQLLARYVGPTAKTSADADASLWPEAMREYAQGRYAQAVVHLKPLLKAQPGNGTGWAVLGLSEYALHDPDDARIHLERGESLGLSGSPDSLREARYTLGLLLIRAGEFEHATEVLTAALKASPHDAAVGYALGLCLLRRAESPEAASPAEQQLVTTAGEITALLKDSRYDEADALFKTLIRRYPSTPFLHYAYGAALLSISEFDQAAAEMRAEIVLSPRSSLPYLRLASIALRQHAPGDAIAASRKALALTPGSAEAHYLLGRALLETGDDTAALHELETAGKLSPDSPEVHFNLARAYTRTRNPEAAAAERATFARLNDLSEAEKSRSGNAIYAGPHETGSVTRQTAPIGSPP